MINVSISVYRVFLMKEGHKGISAYQRKIPSLRAQLRMIWNMADDDGQRHSGKHGNSLGGVLFG